MDESYIVGDEAMLNLVVFNKAVEHFHRAGYEYIIIPSTQDEKYVVSIKSASAYFYPILSHIASGKKISKVCFQVGRSLFAVTYCPSDEQEKYSKELDLQLKSFPFLFNIKDMEYLKPEIDYFLEFRLYIRNLFVLGRVDFSPIVKRLLSAKKK